MESQSKLISTRIISRRSQDLSDSIKCDNGLEINQARLPCPLLIFFEEGCLCVSFENEFKIYTTEAYQ